MFMFISAAVVLLHRNDIFTITGSAMDSYLSSIQIKTLDQMDTVLSYAMTLSTDTPPSFSEQLHEIMFHTAKFTSWIQRYLQYSPCLHISVLDIFRDKGKRTTPFFVCDCRSKKEFGAGRLPIAYHLSPDLLQKKNGGEEVATMLMQLSTTATEKGNKKMHVVVYGMGSHEPPAQGAAEIFLMVAYLISSNVPRVSVIHKGYEACHEFFNSGKIELVNHHAANCIVCKNTPQPPTTANKFLSALKKSSDSKPAVVAPKKSGSILAREFFQFQFFPHTGSDPFGLINYPDSSSSRPISSAEMKHSKSSPSLKATSSATSTSHTTVLTASAPSNRTASAAISAPPISAENRRSLFSSLNFAALHTFLQPRTQLILCDHLGSLPAKYYTASIKNAPPVTLTSDHTPQFIPSSTTTATTCTMAYGAIPSNTNTQNTDHSSSTTPTTDNTIGQSAPSTEEPAPQTSPTPVSEESSTLQQDHQATTTTDTEPTAVLTQLQLLDEKTRQSQEGGSATNSTTAF
ncbi:hypothetical protein Pelo_8450 [Pelomyxa schiedti]|nr:hypothetical protein Pelo_8450 [Pelomyxa schiedti]